jgi:pimeloyl-ACP methyl ester carboxylesterase
MTKRTACAVVAAGLVAGGCGGGDEQKQPSASAPSPTPTATPAEVTATPTPEGQIEGVFKVEGDRGLYLRCTGTGSPTVVMEGGDDDDSSSYAFAEDAIAAETRACVYDRANLGQSDPDDGPRQLSDLVGDLEALLRVAEVPGPLVLVGTSGGGYISAKFAVDHPKQTAGIVFVEVPSPFRNPPKPIVRDTRPDSPVNVEKRDYLQVEKDAWAARRRVGDIPMTILSNRYSKDEIEVAEFPSEAAGMKTNVADQRGWLVLSSRATQVVVHTGHAVEEVDPDLVIKTILDVVEQAR